MTTWDACELCLASEYITFTATQDVIICRVRDAMDIRGQFEVLLYREHPALQATVLGSPGNYVTLRRAPLAQKNQPARRFRKFRVFRFF